MKLRRSIVLAVIIAAFVCAAVRYGGVARAAQNGAGTGLGMPTGGCPPPSVGNPAPLYLDLTGAQLYFCGGNGKWRSVATSFTLLNNVSSFSCCSPGSNQNQESTLYVVPKTGTMQGLRMHYGSSSGGAAVPSGLSYSITAQWCAESGIAGCTPANTPIACTISAGNYDCADTSDAQAVTAGDIINLVLVQSGTGTGTTLVGSLATSIQIQ
jgi:hypothetical protein